MYLVYPSWGLDVKPPCAVGAERQTSALGSQLCGETVRGTKRLCFNLAYAGLKPGTTTQRDSSILRGSAGVRHHVIIDAVAVPPPALLLVTNCRRHTVCCPT